MDFLQISIELVIGYIALFLMTKVLGKTQITQITAFDFISALVIGELVGNAVFDEKVGIGQILFAVILWGTLIFITEITTQKFKKMRKFLEGQPSIIIHKGEIQYNQLKKDHLDINQLQHLLRKKDVYSISECEYAILETDGTVSVIKKSAFATVKNEDLSLHPPETSLPVTLITDGEVDLDNLKEISQDKDWLLSEINKRGLSSFKEVLYCEWQNEKALHIQTY